MVPNRWARYDLTPVDEVGNSTGVESSLTPRTDVKVCERVLAAAIVRISNSFSYFLWRQSFFRFISSQTFRAASCESIANVTQRTVWCSAAEFSQLRVPLVGPSADWLIRIAVLSHTAPLTVSHGYTMPQEATATRPPRRALSRGLLSSISPLSTAPACALLIALISLIRAHGTAISSSARVTTSTRVCTVDRLCLSPRTPLEERTARGLA